MKKVAVSRAPEAPTVTEAITPSAVPNPDKLKKNSIANDAVCLDEAARDVAQGANQTQEKSVKQSAEPGVAKEIAQDKEKATEETQGADNTGFLKKALFIASNNMLATGSAVVAAAGFGGAATLLATGSPVAAAAAGFIGGVMPSMFSITLWSIGDFSANPEEKAKNDAADQKLEEDISRDLDTASDLLVEGVSAKDFRSARQLLEKLVDRGDAKQEALLKWRDGIALIDDDKAFQTEKNRFLTKLSLMGVEQADRNRAEDKLDGMRSEYKEAA